jgi:Bifunctional DNA primase/polymerase, N-terminal/Primase C terminal 1 (PriCT-1)
MNAVSAPWAFPPPDAETLDIVLRSATCGWRLLPCVERGKTPLVQDWPRRASCDADVIRRWAREHEGCNWGVLCGADSGVWVLDVDGEPGSTSLRLLVEQHGSDWTKTLTAKTGTGLHLYFQNPAGIVIRTTAGKLGVGLDIRGAGGYAICPPSTHPSGTRYEWTSPSNGLAPASAPVWLLEMVTSTTRPVVQASEIGILLEGYRNDTLFRGGCYLRRKGWEQSAIESELLAQNLRRCRPPLLDTEVRTIAASAASYPVGGADPLETAWQAIQGEFYPSNYERFLALARELQSARPDQTIALPLQRIGALMGAHWTTVSLYRRRAVTAGTLQPSEQYIPHRRAGLYRCQTGESLPKTLTTLTTGLVRVGESSRSENSVVRENSISRSESESPHSESERKSAEISRDIEAESGRCNPNPVPSEQQPVSRRTLLEAQATQLLHDREPSQAAEKSRDRLQ